MPGPGIGRLAGYDYSGSGLEVFAAFPSFGDKLAQRTLFTPPAWLRIDVDRLEARGCGAEGLRAPPI